MTLFYVEVYVVRDLVKDDLFREKYILRLERTLGWILTFKKKFIRERWRLSRWALNNRRLYIKEAM